jgi:flagellar hook protein FlgE
MSFNTALSGLRAANTDLNVSGNNIANASTIGFKASRVEFGDVYANSALGSGANTAGSGVLVTDIAQQFTQGNVSFTDNSLDLAINGAGFFILSDGGSQAFTRAGTFGLDSTGNLVANNGARLQGNPADAQGNITAGVLQDILIQTNDISPRQTTEAEFAFNLDSRLSPPSVSPFDPTDASTFNSSTSLTVYDSLGNPHVMTQYFIKQAAPNTWNMNVRIDGGLVGGTTAVPAEKVVAMTFNSDGSLNATVPATITIDNWNPTTGAQVGTNGGGVNNPPTTSNFIIDVGKSTQFGGNFSVSKVQQDGFAPGRLTGIEVDKSGIIFTRYTNGASLILGQVGLANFPNPQGLTPLGNTNWAESFDSGQPVIGAPLSGSLGAIQAGALEESNVDLSEELVKLIVAQRNYQANTKTIETVNTVTQALLNVR